MQDDTAGRNTNRKNCLILDIEQYRYQAFISDIAGHDIRAHSNQPEQAINHVRNWLNSASGRKTIPGGGEILRRFTTFETDLPDMCEAVPIELNELTYNDYSISYQNGLLRIEPTIPALNLMQQSSLAE